jgi:hypothetical protein
VNRDDDFDPNDYVQPGSPEAQKFIDGAKIVACRICGAFLLCTMYDDDPDCGTHEAWRAWFSEN